MHDGAASFKNYPGPLTGASNAIELAGCDNVPVGTKVLMLWFGLTTSKSPVFIFAYDPRVLVSSDDSTIKYLADAMVNLVAGGTYEYVQDLNISTEIIDPTNNELLRNFIDASTIDGYDASKPQRLTHQEHIEAVEADPEADPPVEAVEGQDESWKWVDEDEAGSEDRKVAAYPGDTSPSTLDEKVWSPNGTITITSGGGPKVGFDIDPATLPTAGIAKVVDRIITINDGHAGGSVFDSDDWRGKQFWMKEYFVSVGDDPNTVRWGGFSFGQHEYGKNYAGTDGLGGLFYIDGGDSGKIKTNAFAGGYNMRVHVVILAFSQANDITGTVFA
jgi:hypothetical protein